VETQHSIFAAVDLGSNSFKLQVARMVDNQIYLLDSLREPVRLGSGLTEDKKLDEPTQARALACLKRFGECLRGFPAHGVRAVGTNTLRVAKNAPTFLKQAEAALGFPIEVVAGREEARLIYLGVTQSLPPVGEKRLVVDIGGGSTEFIIGSGVRPQKLESLYMGCVSHSLRFFPEGKISKSNMKEAELAARNELQSIASEFSANYWQEAVGSSGTIKALGDILELNGYSDSGITAGGLEKFRSYLLKAGSVDRLAIEGLRTDRAPVIAGGFAILSAVFSELGVKHMKVASGALRQGILCDLLGRIHHKDMREVTVQQFMERYNVDSAQAKSVEALAQELLRQLIKDSEALEDAARLIAWSSRLHEIGVSVAHSGYHKHSAYIIQNADMPGFSKMDQGRMSLLVLAHRGKLSKVRGLLTDERQWSQILALRLAALFYRSRRTPSLQRIQVKSSSSGYYLSLDREWLKRNPLTVMALLDETKEWKSVGLELEVSYLKDLQDQPDYVIAQ
jgi:exopolyphosphatase / guanosine-5'-triphosphate,3'-diphosphate pyrophosphatase